MDPLSRAEKLALRAREMEDAGNVHMEWSIKVTREGEKYLVSTASEEVQKFLSTLLRQTGAYELNDELSVRGIRASLDMPSTKAAEARGDKDWKPCFEYGQSPD